MSGQFPTTPLNLLSKLRVPDDSSTWQVSWKRFLELYHEPLTVIARACYSHHTGGLVASPDFIEDAVANVVTDFFARSQYRYDATKGRLRTYLRVVTNARVVDLLRKERPMDKLHAETRKTDGSEPTESPRETDALHRSLLATLVEDMRSQIPLRQFEIFERVKLKRHSPEQVAEELGIHRAVIDRNVHKAMTKLRELARQPEYQEEFYS